ncbi:MAG: chorismate-binding protein, partial [candidate division Zixibacteria bacterium]|nr:chorismate-binding protein [candidate division Zixibacteria bacterium]
MHAEFSISVRPERFWSLAGKAARESGADLYLCDVSGSHGQLSYVGIGSSREMPVTADSRRSDIADFAFADADPTFGFLSYNYGLQQRGLTTAKVSRFPLGHLKKYATLLTYDPVSEELRLSGSGQLSPRDLQALLDDNPCPQEKGSFDHGRIPPFVPSLDRDGYIEGVSRVLDYIKQGYTYQLCLSIKFTTRVEKLDAAELFMYLWRRKPASFYSFFHSGPYRVISTSPERFFQVR